MKRVLVIGAGAREHALAWKLSQSPQVTKLIVAPGNDGMSPAWERWPADLNQKKPEFERLARKAKVAGVDLVVVGPDNPLAEGLVDVFQSEELLCFGPTAAAAQLEASKAFAKEVMNAALVPTAQYRLFTELEEAEEFLKSAQWPESGGSGWVIKADGLAFGKGVRVCENLFDAIQAVRELLPVSGKLVIEEKLQGEEISWMAICDGERSALLEPARDYKRLRDEGEGPNTGGMGSFSPVPGIPPHWAERIQEEVFESVLREMERRDSPFRGVLYAGLMVDLEKDRYWVLEFNARFGDPETQVLMPRWDGDIYEWFEAAARGELYRLPPQVSFHPEAAVYVVAAAEGYPDRPRKGAAIASKGPLSAPDYFLAGVTGSGEGLRVSGGRVLGALGRGQTLEQARELAYQKLNQVKFEGMQFRKDIAR